MKLSIALAFLMMSMSSFAAWIEVECVGKKNDTTVRLEIEEAFPRGSAFKDARLEVTGPQTTQTFDYTVNTRFTRGMPRINYWGGGLRLEVDLWPDRVPRWGRTYRAEMRSSDLDMSYVRLDCRYPNIY